MPVEWVSEWDQGALGTFLGGIGAIMSGLAFLAARRARQAAEAQGYRIGAARLISLLSEVSSYAAEVRTIRTSAAALRVIVPRWSVISGESDFQPVNGQPWEMSRRRS